MATMPTAMDTPGLTDTMARGPLMPRLPLRLMLMLTMVPTDMAFPMPDMDTVLATTDTVIALAMPTTDTTDIPMPTTDTTARGPLMPRLPLRLRPMLMLTTDTTDTPVPMPTTDTTDIPMPTTDTTATPT